MHNIISLSSLTCNKFVQQIMYTDKMPSPKKLHVGLVIYIYTLSEAILI